jgi:hypothetical protein
MPVDRMATLEERKETVQRAGVSISEVLRKRRQEFL